ncbi:ribonuclease P protein component [Streptococcus pyogenes]|uniref:ribonuclease P protein component n=1 Tax=Streptococcus pyogenes TaxID=1314 RepID=UPI0010A147F3|nr:ribonuclease P protein component [Streptococcus pyogenes]VGV52368.1 ribonuclease P protein component [Streptococcus pyogenes]VGV78695.1 ribonuclease P protein component [Streptococcus pyogenes]VGW22291.1 ribonuclease P protein component [Streptococcus pyogenes]VHC10870.1 ribonuclease P protein component [Streptococcus pyogenes]VHC66691.1 ribonuclease P protein component [Streptococcus pyogenes]
MKKTYRVKREKDFQAIFKDGKSTANRKFVIYHLNRGQDHFRVGISVGKKIGNAVTRNAVKRKIRHVIMVLGHQLKSEDFVVIARKGVESLEYQELQQNLHHVLKLAQLLEKGFESEEKH